MSEDAGLRASGEVPQSRALLKETFVHHVLHFEVGGLSK